MQELCTQIKYYKQVPNTYILSIPTFNESYSCPNEVLDRLKELKFSIQYDCFIGTVPIQIKFYTEKQNSCLNRFKVIMTVLRLLNPVEPVFVDFLLTSVKKALPKQGLVGQSTLNTGYTLNKIVVYREEEWFKVFIHECMHLLLLDEGLRNKDTLIQTLFPLKIRVELNESYCEVWARILNCCVISVYNSLSVHDLLKKESAFSIKQMNKVLKYMNLTYDQLFNPKTVYKENTNAFAYLVLGAILMTDPYAFVDWCQVHNSSLFNVTKATEYILLIKSMYDADELYKVSRHAGTRSLSRSRSQRRGGEWKPELSTKMSINNIDL